MTKIIAGGIPIETRFDWPEDTIIFCHPDDVPRDGESYNNYLRRVEDRVAVISGVRIEW